MRKIEIKSLDNIAESAKEFVREMGDATVFAFYGEMGVGKTTFIKEICKVLGVEDQITSPTFAIVNEYRSATTAELIYHFDFYRVENIEEVYDFGYEDYFYSGAICFIEWPERVESLLPKDVVSVWVKELANGDRIVELK